MTLEELEPLEIRAHHLEVFIRDTRQTIKREVASDYSPELAVKVLEMYDAIVSGRRIKMVPGIDDICKQCMKLCPKEKDEYCEINDSEPIDEFIGFNPNQIAEDLRLREGSIYSFEELQAREREKKCELQDPDSEARGMQNVFGNDIEAGRTYTPMEMIGRAMRYTRSEIQKKEMLPEKYRDNILLETQRQRLAGLESVHERLRRQENEH